MYALNGCVLNNCTVSAYTGACPNAAAKDYATCQSDCLIQTCLDEYVDFVTDTDAVAMNVCLNGCKGNAACQKDCQTAAGAAAVAVYQALVQCATDNSCLGK